MCGVEFPVQALRNKEFFRIFDVIILLLTLYRKMMPEKKELYVTNSREWRKWLDTHHSFEKEIWLILYKKHTGKPSIPYENAVEEALCFGWIDSTIRKIDEEKYAQKYTPRKDKSNWSESNKKRVERLISQGRMTEAGMVKIKAAQHNGQWNKTLDSKKTWIIPDEFDSALSANKKAREYFDSLAPSYKLRYVGWIASGKKVETRIKRSKEAISLLEHHKKPGMK